MTQEMKRNIVKAAPNRWLVFCILTLSGGIAFKLSSMKDMFYVPMQEFMGLTNTQIGGAMSMYGTVQTIGLIAGIYICEMCIRDRHTAIICGNEYYVKQKMIPVNRRKTP